MRWHIKNICEGHCNLDVRAPGPCETDTSWNDFTLICSENDGEVEAKENNVEDQRVWTLKSKNPESLEKISPRIDTGLTYGPQTGRDLWFIS